MSHFVQPRAPFACLIALAMLFPLWILPSVATAQDDPNEAPLGDVARNLRKKTPPAKAVIDDDNLSTVMDQIDNKHGQGTALKFVMVGDSKNFQISAPDATCSLSFSVNAKALLTSQYAQMDLPPSEVLKLEGPATIEGDALSVSVFNHTEWHVSEVAVALMIVRKNTAATSLPGTDIPAAQSGIAPFEFSPDQVRPEKKQDATVIYRMRAAAPPSTTTVFAAPLNLDLAPGDEWHWAIVQARGYPPEGRYREGHAEQGVAEKDSSISAEPNSPITAEPAPLNASPVSLTQPQ